MPSTTTCPSLVRIHEVSKSALHIKSEERLSYLSRGVPARATETKMRRWIQQGNRRSLLTSVRRSA